MAQVLIESTLLVDVRLLVILVAAPGSGAGFTQVMIVELALAVDAMLAQLAVLRS